MTPRTRSSNKDADYKVYYAEKIPEQAHFPHKRKTVRRRTTPTHDASGGRQMVFLPEKMKAWGRRAVRDSDSEERDSDEDVQPGGYAISMEADEGGKAEELDPVKAAKGRCNKHSSDIMLEDDEPIRLAPRRRPRPLESDSEERESAKRRRTLRRQSTLTQILDGRRPLSDEEEADFIPVKRSSKTTWSATNRKQQQTLTQMIPGIMLPESDSSEDMGDVSSDIEVQAKDGHAYGDAVARRLAQQGLHRADNEDDHGEIDNSVAPSIETNIDDISRHVCPPTRLLKTPKQNTRQNPLWQPGRSRTPQFVDTVSIKTHRSSKYRFGLLSTPEKRNVREIASSQSPAESPLSIRSSSQKSQRWPLQACAGNTIQAPDTLSRRKQHTFEETSTRTHQSMTLKKFRGVIQDSEDEDEDPIEEIQPLREQRMGAPMQRSPQSSNHDVYQNAVGADAQLMLRKIDEACASREGTRSPEELSVYNKHCNDYEASPELGDSRKPEPVSASRSSTEISTLTAVEEDSVEEEFVMHSFAPLKSSHALSPSPSIRGQYSADLDGEVTRPPSSPSKTHETQQSHSSKAEQQLQKEWLSYSQYAINSPQSSSTGAVRDAFSYYDTHRPSHPIALEPHFSGHHLSQATTVDEVTPKKNRTRFASSQPYISPSKPPPLYIPSSFPSPTKAAMDAWSSPVFGRTQDALRSSQFGASLEDFSIPLPPPEDD